MDHESFMRLAIEVAGANPAQPFGAVLVHRQTGRVVARGVNRTAQNPTWHGEIDAINQYAVHAGPPWRELDLYTTAEPCPMCQAAILWAGIARVVYGTSIAELKALGWNQIDIDCREVTRRTPFIDCEIVGGVLEAECDRLFRDARSPAAG